MNDVIETTKKNIITYFKGVRTEWGKITWPEKNQVVVETFFVVAIVFTFTVFIYVVDKIFVLFCAYIYSVPLRIAKVNTKTPTTFSAP